MSATGWAWARRRRPTSAVSGDRVGGAHTLVFPSASAGRLQSAGRAAPTCHGPVAAHHATFLQPTMRTRAVLKEVVRVHASIRAFPPTSNSSTSSRRICFATRVTAIPPRLLDSERFARTLALTRPLQARRRAARHRARSRLRLVAEARRATCSSATSRRSAMRCRHGDVAAVTRLLAIAARHGTGQRSDVRVRSACRAHRRETRSRCSRR